MAGSWEQRGSNSFRLKYMKDGEPYNKTIKVLGKSVEKLKKWWSRN